MGGEEQDVFLWWNSNSHFIDMRFPTCDSSKRFSPHPPTPYGPKFVRASLGWTHYRPEFMGRGGAMYNCSAVGPKSYRQCNFKTRALGLYFCNFKIYLLKLITSNRPEHHQFGPCLSLPVSQKLAIISINQKQALAQLNGLFFLVY